MVTKYIIPCSSCGKPVERYVFCSGACKVRGFRTRRKKIEEIHTLDESYFKRAKEVNPEEKIPIKKLPVISTGKEFTELMEKPLPYLSNIKQPGYHFSPMLGKYVKDD